VPRRLTDIVKRGVRLAIDDFVRDFAFDRAPDPPPDYRGLSLFAFTSITRCPACMPATILRKATIVNRRDLIVEVWYGDYRSIDRPMPSKASG